MTGYSVYYSSQSDQSDQSEVHINMFWLPWNILIKQQTTQSSIIYLPVIHQQKNKHVKQQSFKSFTFSLVPVPKYTNCLDLCHSSQLCSKV